MKLVLFFLLSLGLLATEAQVDQTSMQATLKFRAPSSAACDIDVKRLGDSTVIDDVNGALFSGANLDSRSTSVNNGLDRKIVLGKRAAEMALDGKRHSRTLQVFTTYVYSLCSGTITGQFKTFNAPLGQAYGEPPPVDPTIPGEYAFPTFSWTDRTFSAVDPLTGFLTKLLDGPGDGYINQNQFNSVDFTGATGTGWTTPGNAGVNDSAVASYNGASKDPLFLPTGLFNNAQPSYSYHDANNLSLNKLNPFFNAWADTGKTIEVAITVDSQAPASLSSWLPHAVAGCVSSCTGAGNQFNLITTPATMLADWFPANNGLSTVDLSDFMARAGTVDRVGTIITFKGGDRFCLKWTAGSKITVNSVVYTIASVDHDQQITATTGSGSESNVPYTASNAGFLVRNQSTSGTISIQYANYAYEVTGTNALGSGGDGDANNNCSPITTTFNGEAGFRCINGNVVRWIGKDSLTVNRLFNAKPQFNGSAPFWSSVACGSTFWSQTDANSLYCTIPDGAQQSEILKFTYNGSNADIGDLSVSDAAVYCSGGSPPCVDVTLVTATSVEAQAMAFDPRWVGSNFNIQGSGTSMFGFMPGSNAALLSIRSQDQDSLCFIVKLDLNTGLIVGSVNSWSSWPLRWSSCHGAQNIVDPRYAIVPATTFRGPFSGTDIFAGNGPYITTVTNAVSGTASPCPAAPNTLPIQIKDWPIGTHCSTFTLNGEPGDPTPRLTNAGTVTTIGTAVTGTGTAFLPGIGRQMKIGSTYYGFTYIDSTHGTLTGSPGVTGSAYTLYLEPVNNPKVGNAAYAYLADVGVGDYLSIAAAGTDGTGSNGGAYYPSGLENIRVIAKSGFGPGAVLTVERGYGGAQGYTALSSFAAGSTLITLPGGCTFSSDAPCAHTFVDWDTTDPLGVNADGKRLILDSNDLGCCHGTSQNIRVNFGINGTCSNPNRDNLTSVCHYARAASIPEVYTTTGVKVAISPLFHGLSGVGYTNSVDTHPSHGQFLAKAGTPDYNWVGDFRPFLGDDKGNLFGSSGSPGVQTGQRWKFISSKTNRLRSRVLASFACCGLNPLKDISGPGSVLGTTSSDSYKYCIALLVNECVTGSAVGDVYLNCPQMRLGYSFNAGTGGLDTDARDMVIADMSMYVHSSVQVGVTRPDPDGAYGRVVSKISRYKPSVFANVKESPDGRILFHSAVALNGVRTSVLLVKLPPFPSPDSANRNDYNPPILHVPAFAGTNNVIVKFGYDPSFNCTTRTDICMANASTVPTGLTPFAYASESPSGLACSLGCDIAIPAVPQRIVYCQVLYRDGSNNVIKTEGVQVFAVQ